MGGAGPTLGHRGGGEIGQAGGLEQCPLPDTPRPLPAGETVVQGGLQKPLQTLPPREVPVEEGR